MLNLGITVANAILLHFLSGSPILSRFSNGLVKLAVVGRGRQHARFGVKGVIGQRYFTVEARTGIVKLKAQFDREVSTDCVRRDA